ncbi:Uncharacterized protein APZ42_032575 [Daphnia magna]|uniref:Uncharacterized protein n=1 Tax=Daphnia magna TaxID=35525 RepID=A0A164LNV1_9CRUS|nr:Uncharacterized protein APZ42_032575 [Daphnia magna]
MIHLFLVTSFVDKSFPGRQPTTTMRVREQCVESDIALETPGGFLLQQDYKVLTQCARLMPDYTTQQSLG